MKIKQQRLANQIKKILAEIIQFDLKDPNLGLVTITDVDLSADLSVVKVYVMVSGSSRQRKKTLAALEHGQGFIRSALAKELTTYKTPEIRFFYDDSFDKAQRIDDLIKLANQPASEE